MALAPDRAMRRSAAHHTYTLHACRMRDDKSDACDTALIRCLRHSMKQGTTSANMEGGNNQKQEETSTYNCPACRQSVSSACEHEAVQICYVQQEIHSASCILKAQQANSKRNRHGQQQKQFIKSMQMQHNGGYSILFNSKYGSHQAPFKAAKAKLGTNTQRNTQQSFTVSMVAARTPAEAPTNFSIPPYGLLQHHRFWFEIITGFRQPCQNMQRQKYRLSVFLFVTAGSCPSLLHLVSQASSACLLLPLLGFTVGIHCRCTRSTPCRATVQRQCASSLARFLAATCSLKATTMPRCLLSSLCIPITVTIHIVVLALQPGIAVNGVLRSS